MGDCATAPRGTCLENPVDHDLERPRLEEPHRHFREQCQDGQRDQLLFFAYLRSEVAKDPEDSRGRSLRVPHAAPAAACSSRSGRVAGCGTRDMIWSTTCNQVCELTASSRAERPSFSRRDGDAQSSCNALASATPSPGGQSTPVTPSSITSAIWPTALATMGNPAAIYSKTLRGEK